jgi:hypothetical protein
MGRAFDVMEKQTIDFIKDRFRGETIYTDIEELSTIDNIIDASMIIGDKVDFFYTERIITNPNNINSIGYAEESINKDWSLYTKHLKTHDKLYYTNYNDDLFELQTKRIDRACYKIAGLEGPKAKPLLIVGAGQSWRDIDYDTIDAHIMVINYNFDIRANYQIYHDRRVAENTSGVNFKDGRIVIGASGNPEYLFSPGSDTHKRRHTGAYAVDIAQRIGYEKIYLIGYDYDKGDNGRYHTYQDNHETNNENKMNLFLSDFDNMNYGYDNIFNLNPNSRLKKFPFAESIK